MAVIRPFLCIRPEAEAASRVAALPYDVYSREEAKREVEKEPLSFLGIDRAETGLPDSVDEYAPEVYERARELLCRMEEEGIFVKEKSPCYYLYELTMDGHSQTGLVACSSVDDYVNHVIKKHENTREEKEQDRIRHVDVTNAQTGPIFLAYRRTAAAEELICREKEKEALYDFISPDGVRHRVFRIAGEDKLRRLTEAFAKIPSTYIADGHHRAASAVKVALKRRAEHPGYDGTEEFNYFLSVLFPAEELKILSYNRVVRDLNGLTAEEFLEKLGENFVILEGEEQKASDSEEQKASGHEVRKIPAKKGQFCMYLDGRWYTLDAKKEILTKDPVKGLDVSLLQDYLLEPVLGIADPRTDRRIAFIGGIRGTKELERRCGEDMRVAFSMYPTSMEELLSVADAGLLMPPKSTWFEPKLRSGLFIHELS